jgi:hypothetical protein
LPRPRHEYVLALGVREVPAEDPSVRSPEAADLEALARLMLAAYEGTIDYDGETIAEAREEVARYFAGRPLLEVSWLRLDGGDVISAVLVSHWAERSCPLVGYVMTAPERKGAGAAADVLARSLGSLAADGHTEVRAVITEGNVPSERLFASAGFRRA